LISAVHSSPLTLSRRQRTATAGRQKQSSFVRSFYLVAFVECARISARYVSIECMFDRDRQKYVLYPFEGGKWKSGIPVVNICESFWVAKSEAANWTQSLTLAE
jgi:hypothetical protein